LWGEGATTLKVSNDALHRCEQYCVSCDAEHTWNVYGQPRTSVPTAKCGRLRSRFAVKKQIDIASKTKKIPNGKHDI